MKEPNKIRDRILVGLFIFAISFTYGMSIQPPTEIGLGAFIGSVILAVGWALLMSLLTLCVRMYAKAYELINDKEYTKDMDSETIKKNKETAQGIYVASLIFVIVLLVVTFLINANAGGVAVLAVAITAISSDTIVDFEEVAEKLFESDEDVATE